VTAPSETRTPNVELVALRDEAGLSQQDLADELNGLAGRKYGKYPNLTKKTVGRWERGEVEWPQPFYRRLLADYFKCAVDELGFRRPRRLNPETVGCCSDEELFTFGATSSTLDPRVEQDQRQWRETRQILGSYRRELAIVAERLYPEFVVPGLENTGVITHPSWLASEPVPMRSVVIDLDEHVPAPAITGSERDSAQVRPLTSMEQRYQRYSHAVRDLASPRLFENRLCFRVIGIDWTMPVAQLQFGAMCFFDSIDTNEALAHEMALHHMSRDHRGDVAAIGRASWRRLTFRKLIGDPFNLERRPLMGSIGTLTIRGGESPSMVFHQRDGDRVAGGGGMVHLLPAGIFQPSSVLPSAIAADFSIWRNIQREYSEELLGSAEHDGSGQPINYSGLEPFVTMDQGLSDGQVRVYYLGFTLDALTLCADLLTVSVFDPELYDHLFCDSVSANDEGTISTRAIPFESHTIARLREGNQLSPGAVAAIHLAWIHRKVILAGQ
jgi:transcriptional regulator with XRE-family HTH domain